MTYRVEKRQAKNQGFTLVEMLIVIVVIAILAAISVIAYNGIQARAQDARRVQDIASIKKALLLYDTTNGGVQSVNTFSGGGAGGWNYSVGPNWLKFLESSYGKMPVDPINNSATDNMAVDKSYKYYCYAAGTYGYTEATVVLGYWSQVRSSQVNERFVVSQCK